MSEPPGDPVPPRYLLAGPAEAGRVLRRLARAGWSVREGSTLPEEPWDVAADRLVVTAAVTDEAGAADVVLAAARGAAVVVVAERGSEAHAVLSADLSRIGPLLLDAGTDPEAGRPGTQRTVPGLTAEQCALLDRLAGGASIPGAAEQEFLSLRTANRRIAAARRALGVGSTRAAVLEYRRRLRD